MKRKGFAFFLFLVFTIGVGASTSADLVYFIPADSQVVLELRDLTFFHDVFKLSGWQDRLLPMLGPALAQALKDPNLTITAADLDDLAKSTIVMSTRFYDPETKSINPKAVLALRLGSAKINNAVKAMLGTASEKGRKVGAFTVLTENSEANEHHPKELKTIAFSEDLLVLGYQYDVGEFAAALLAQAKHFEWPKPAVGVVHVQNENLKTRFLVRGAEFGNWTGDAMDLILKSLPKPSDPSSAKEGESKEAAAAQAAQAIILNMFPPDKIRQFAAGLGLDNLRDVMISFEEQAGVYRMVFSLGVAEGDGLLNRILKSSEGAQLTAVDLFPAGTSLAMDTLLDFAAVYGMLKADVVKAFGEGLGNMINLGEAALSIGSGLSLTDHVFPLLGKEFGSLQVGKLKNPLPVLDMLPFNTVFTVPQDKTAVDKAIGVLAGKFGITVVAEDVKDGKWYKLSGGAEHPMTVHVLLLKGVLFVTMVQEAVEILKADVEAGKTFAEKESVRAYLAKARKNGAKTFSYSLESGEKNQVLANSPIAPFYNKVFDAGLFGKGESFGAAYCGPGGCVTVSELPVSQLKGMSVMIMDVLQEMLTKADKAAPKKVSPASTDEAAKPAEKPADDAAPSDK